MVTVTLENWIDADRRIFQQKKSSSSAGMVGIKNALEDGVTGIIKEVSEDSRKDIFYMLCFCISVPQSRAISVDKAVTILRDRKFYENGLSVEELTSVLLAKARFQNRKANYLSGAREIFLDTKFWEELNQIFKSWPSKPLSDKRSVRTRFDRLFKGLGLKEISHWLRNIGMPGLAIIDIHVLRALKERNLVSEESVLTKTNYCCIEDVMIQYATAVGISLEELDLLFWSESTGFVFK